jgi:hypothetical protein
MLSDFILLSALKDRWKQYLRGGGEASRQALSFHEALHPFVARFDAKLSTSSKLNVYLCNSKVMVTSL